jgi:hypothetical protein
MKSASKPDITTIAATTATRRIISDKLVIEKTMKTLEQWFKVLDRKGAKQMSHKEIFEIVTSIPGLKMLGEWNHNLLTTSYEWDRGLKQRGQREAGFEISVSKTTGTPVEELYNAWIISGIRAKWLGKEKITIRKATENKSVRITWSDNVTSLSVDFYPLGAHKSKVVVQHQKIADSVQAAELKSYWTGKLSRLSDLLHPDK